MSEFSISFVPPLALRKAARPPTSLLSLNISHINAVYKIEHRIEYMVNGKIYTYYPASIITVINDIEFELRLVRARENHAMTLSGYEVLLIEFQKESARLIDPVAQNGNGHGKVIGNFVASEIEAQFEVALSNVWGLIKSL